MAKASPADGPDHSKLVQRMEVKERPAANLAGGRGEVPPSEAASLPKVHFVAWLLYFTIPEKKLLTHMIKCPVRVMFSELH